MTVRKMIPQYAAGETLPTTGVSAGDTVIQDGSIKKWSGTAWVAASSGGGSSTNVANDDHRLVVVTSIGTTYNQFTIIGGNDYLLTPPVNYQSNRSGFPEAAQNPYGGGLTYDNLDYLFNFPAGGRYVISAYVRVDNLNPGDKLDLDFMYFGLDELNGTSWHVTETVPTGGSFAEARAQFFTTISSVTDYPFSPRPKVNVTTTSGTAKVTSYGWSCNVLSLDAAPAAVPAAAVASLSAASNATGQVTVTWTGAATTPAGDANVAVRLRRPGAYATTSDTAFYGTVNTVAASAGTTTFTGLTSGSYWSPLVTGTTTKNDGIMCPAVQVM